MVKKLIGILLTIICAFVWAQEEINNEDASIGTIQIETIQQETRGEKGIPYRMNYQGYLTDNLGNPINGTVSMGISIWTASSGGTQLWSETQNVTVQNGLFNVILGVVSSIPYSIFEPGQSRWLQLVANGQTLSPRSEITSVGFAYRTIKADTSQYAYATTPIPHNHFGETWSGSADSALTIKNNTTTTSAAVYGFKNYVSVTSSPDAYGIYSNVTNSYANGDAIGLYGRAEATNYGYVTGVEGRGHTTRDDAEGVYGYSRNNSTSSSDWSTGVSGYGDIANGSQGTVFGGHFTGAGESGVGEATGIFANGRGASTSASYGIRASAENSSSGAVYAGYFEARNYGTGIKFGIYATAPTTPAGSYAGRFVGNFLATGGTKSCGVKLNDGKYYQLYCQESPEVWFEDFGKGNLTNGIAIVEIDPMFIQSANTEIEYHVFLTPEEQAIVLAVANKTPTCFEVRGLNGTNIPFSYRIVAKRRGFENLRFEPVVGPTPEKISTEHERFMETVKEKEKKKLNRFDSGNN